MDELFKSGAYMGLCLQDNLRRRAGVLAGVVVGEVQTEGRFEVGQAVATLSFELGPCLPGDPDAIAPAEFGRWQMVGTAGSGNGGFIEVAVLDKVVAVEKPMQQRPYLRKGGRPRHSLGAYAMEPDVERRKWPFGIDIGRPAFDPVSVINAGNADLAYAGNSVAGGLDIKRDKAKRACRQRRGMRTQRALPCSKARKALVCGVPCVQKVLVTLWTRAIGDFDMQLQSQGTEGRFTHMGRNAGFSQRLRKHHCLQPFREVSHKAPPC